MGGLEATQQFVERFQDLARQLRRYDVLVFAAVLQDRRKTLFRVSEHAIRVQQFVQRGKDRPPGNLHHVRQTESDVAARLDSGGIHQTNLPAIHEQADPDAGLAQEPLEACLRAGLPPARLHDGHAVEVGSSWQDFDQQYPLARGICRLKIVERVCEPEHLSGPPAFS